MGKSTDSKLIKLKLTPCEVDKSGNISSIQENKSYNVKINPQQYTHKQSVCLGSEKTFGQAYPDVKFLAMAGETVSFKIVIDGTGVTNITHPKRKTLNVQNEIKLLNSIVYEYKGNDHRPQLIRLLWGSMKFFGRLSSLNITYTLFKPNGSPLRASVDLSFTGFMSKAEKELRANKSSPDLTHLVEVKSGDTLPLLCYKIYNDASYYMKVAKVNGLSNFRHLVPGSKLIFPPLY